MSFKNIYREAVGVRALWEHRKRGDEALRREDGGRADSSSWRVGVEIQWIIKSTALLVCECHQGGEKMTCRNVTVCHCGVECQGSEGGAPTGPIWVSSLPFPVGSPGPGPHDHFFLDSWSWFWTLLSRVKYSPSGREVIILWLDQDSSRLRELHWFPCAFSTAWRSFTIRSDFPVWHCLLCTPLLHTFRVSQMDPDTYLQHFPCVFESCISPKHKSIKSSSLDPSIVPWANVIPPFPKSCFAWHLSVVFSYNYFIILCEPMEGKIMLIYLEPILT